MSIEQNDYMEPGVSGLKQLTADEKIRLVDEARQFALMDQRSNYKAGIADAEKRLLPIIKEKEKMLEELDKQIEALDKQIEAMDKQIEAMDKQIEAMDKQLEERNLTLKKKDAGLLHLKELL